MHAKNTTTQSNVTDTSKTYSNTIVMKRRLLFFVLFALFAGASATSASELNIYASGLRLHGETPVTGENQVHIDYFLNAPATELKFLVFAADADVSSDAALGEFTIPAGTDNANYAKGSHSDVVLDLSSFYGEGNTYKWAIKAKAANKNALTLVSNAESFYATRGVAINNFPETENFGYIYISQCTSGTSNSIAKTKGIFVYNPAITCLNPTATTGIKDATWVADGAGSSAVGSPHRVTIAEDGEVYISCSKAPTGVWKLPDGDPLQSLVKVVDGGTPYGLCVTGTGSSRKLYTLDGIAYSSGCVGNILSYAIGNNSLPYTGGSTTFKTASSVSLGNAHCDIESDKKGGFWMTQNRGTDATGLSILSHLTSNGTKNYNSSAGSLSLSNSTRGVVAVNKDGSQVATCSGGAVKVFTVNFSGATPSLSLAYTAPASGTIGTNIDGLAFDYANNLYVVSSTSERLHIYAPAASNTCTTPAASSLTIVLGSYIPPTPVTGVELNETSKTLVKGQSFTLVPTIAPADATNKNVTWQSSDPTVASVSEGVVTALKKGTTTITATSDDQPTISVTCEVTVNLLHGTYHIGGTNEDYSSLSSAVSALNTIGIDGDITLLICANIAENANIGLTNNTDYSITIRPDAADKRIITFGSQADNAGPSGHLMIGYDLTGWSASPAKNILIDGSFNNEGQYLEFVAGTQGGIVACFYGHVTNSAIKNCRLINGRTSGSNAGVVFRVEQLASGKPAAANQTNNSPENTGLDNCYIQVLGTPTAQGIHFNAANASAIATGGPKDCFVRSCEINTRQRGIHLQGVVNVEITGNTIHMPDAPTGYLASAIMGTNASGTITIANNKFLELATNNVVADANGIRGITASGNATSWIIENNYFAGLNAKAAGVTDKDFFLTYIRCGDPCTIRHNTFYMPSLSNKPATDITSANPIACVYLAGSNTYVVQNNLFVSEETEANNSLIRGNINTTYVNNNVFYHNGGNAAIVADEAVYKTWDEFTTADAGSKWVEPHFADAASGDLGIIVADNNLKVARLADILTDIYGNNRPEQTYAGACEPIAVTTINGIDATLTLEDINDTHTFKPTVLPSNTSFPTITWTSSNENVATVVNGTITARGKGEATITATAGGFSVTCIVTVTAGHSLSGTYRIGGEGAAYSTLHEACADLCTYGLVGDATFLICADLNESANCGIINNTDYTLTIRPDAALKRTITFGSQADNIGPSGHLMIGYDLTGWTASLTKNIVIDGSFNNAGQYIEFVAGTQGGIVACFYGHVTNSYIKNCRLINGRTTGENSVIQFRVEQLGGGSRAKNTLATANMTDNSPENVGIENCYIHAIGTTTAQGVYYNAANAKTVATGGSKNCYVRNCEIYARQRGIHLQGATHPLIEGNTIHIQNGSNGLLACAILGTSTNGIVTVRENQVVEVATNNTYDNSYGIQGITAAGSADKWIIENNYFGGMSVLNEAVTSKDFVLTYIHCTDLCEIRHNTFHMPSLTNKPGTALESTTPIACIRLNNDKSHTIENNLFVSDETEAHNSLISGTLPAELKHNVFYHAEGNASLTSSSDNIETLDASNTWQEVAFSETYKPATAYANSINLAMPRIDGLYTDIESNERETATHAGCYAPKWTITLNDAQANTATINKMNGVQADVIIQRSFAADEGWYTLVLPFDVPAEQMAANFGNSCQLTELEESYWKVPNTMMYIRFSQRTNMLAGAPYLIKPAQNVSSLHFENVTIDADLQPNETELVDMTGLYDPTNEIEADGYHYYLGDYNLLYPYTEDYHAANAFRAYFSFNISNPSGCSARIIFHEDAATGLEAISDQQSAVSCQKVIRDGQLIIIRNGQEYTIDGRMR